MRIQVDALSDVIYKQLEDMVEQGLVEPSLVKPILQEIENNKGAYLRRLYGGAVSLDAKGLAAMKADPRYTQSIENSAKIIMKTNPEKTLDEAMSEATKSVDRAILGDLSEGSLSPEAILNLKKRGDMTGSSRIKEVPLYTISEGFFKKRSVFLDKNPQLRELMNEIRDPKVLFTQTISDLSKFVGTNNLYKSMARMTDEGGFSETFETAIPKINNWLTKAKDSKGKLVQASRPLIVKGEDLTPQQIADLQAAGYKQLGKRVPQKSKVI